MHVRDCSRLVDGLHQVVSLTVPERPGVNRPMGFGGTRLRHDLCQGRQSINVNGFAETLVVRQELQLISDRFGWLVLCRVEVGLELGLMGEYGLLLLTQLG